MAAIPAGRGLTRGLSSHLHGREGSGVGKPVLQKFWRDTDSATDTPCPMSHHHKTTQKMIDYASILRLNHERCHHCRTTDFKCFLSPVLILASLFTKLPPAPQFCRVLHSILFSVKLQTYVMIFHISSFPSASLDPPNIFDLYQSRTMLRPVMELLWVCCLAVLFCVVANSKGFYRFLPAFKSFNSSRLPCAVVTWVPTSLGC